MDNNELRDILNAYLAWNKARMAFFVGMLIALFKVRTINLTELACGFSSNATVDSRYKRSKNHQYHRKYQLAGAHPYTKFLPGKNCDITVFQPLFPY